MHNSKVKQLEQRVDQYVRSHEKIHPYNAFAHKGHYHSVGKAPGVQSGANLDTGGILKLCDGDQVRKQGNSLIAR